MIKAYNGKAILFHVDDDGKLLECKYKANKSVDIKEELLLSKYLKIKLHSNENNSA
jgi:antitoxin component YwqK of YwqJK toxin-antitoxin module